MGLRSIWAVFCFECRRSITVLRVTFLVGLALFPVAIVSLMQYQNAHLDRDGVRIAVILFVLIPELVCLMTLLLWAAPAIHCEVESRTWSYLAIRPAGRASILLGKYLNTVLWATCCAWISVSLCYLAVPFGTQPLRLWAVIMGLIPLSAVVYGALFSLFAVLFLRRAMVMAVGYTALLEIVVALIPAKINQLSVQFHLRCLLAKWMHLAEQRQFREIVEMAFSTLPPWQHLLILAALAASLLTAAVLVLRHRQLVTADEA